MSISSHKSTGKSSCSILVLCNVHTQMTGHKGVIFMARPIHTLLNIYGVTFLLDKFRQFVLYCCSSY